MSKIAKRFTNRPTLIILAGILVFAGALFLCNSVNKNKPISKVVTTHKTVSIAKPMVQSDPPTPENLLKWTNDYRVAGSGSPLQLSAALDQSAQAKCDDAAVSTDFEHIQKDGNTWQTFINRYYGTNYYYSGENLIQDANTQLSTANSIISKWYIDFSVPDLGHRKNIMNSNYQYVGFGICHPTKFPSITYAVQQFVGN